MDVRAWYQLSGTQVEHNLFRGSRQVRGDSTSLQRYFGDIGDSHISSSRRR